MSPLMLLAAAFAADVPAQVIVGAAYADRDPAMNLVDVFVPAHAQADGPLPILIWVHGGGWHKGSRAQLGEHKERFFKARRAIIVSVDYRLSNGSLDVDGTPIQFPDHPLDVADAVTWVHDHAASWGGDPSNITLLGYSAGGHLVSLVATNPAWLGEVQPDIRCVAALDIEALDIVTHMENTDPEDRTWELYHTAFGDDPQVWADASPISWIRSDQALPDFLLVRRGKPQRRAIADAFAARVESTGARVTLVDADLYDHDQIHRMIGDPADLTLSPPLATFLDRCLHEPPAPRPLRVAAVVESPTSSTPAGSPTEPPAEVFEAVVAPAPPPPAEQPLAIPEGQAAAAIVPGVPRGSSHATGKPPVTAPVEPPPAQPPAP